MPWGVPLEFDRKEFASRWNAGETVASMAAWMGCTGGRVERLASEMGLQPRSEMMKTQVDVPKLFRLWQTDLTRREIALELGIREGHLNKLADKYGLPCRGQRQHQSGKTKVDPFLMPADEYERRKAEVKAMSMARKRLERYEPRDI